MTDEKPKYLNTSDTPAFKKSNNLFALNKAKNSKSDKLILCEGYMDVIAIHQAGFDYAIATLGTALTVEQARIIRRYTNNVVICYDADEAGQKATARAIDILRQENLNIRVLTVPDGKDPDEFIRKNGEDGHIMFKRLIEGTGTDIEYQLQKLRSRFDVSSTDGQVKFMNSAARIIARIDNPVERDLYEGKLCTEFDITKTEFKRLVASVMNGINRKEKTREFDNIKKQLALPDTAPAAASNGRKTRKQKAEEFVIAYLMNNPDMVRTVYKDLKPENISDGLNRMLYRTITDRVLSGRPAAYGDIAGEFTQEENSLVAAILSRYSPELCTPDVCRDYVNVIISDHESITPESLSQRSDEDIRAYLEAVKNKKLKNKQ